MSTNPPLPAEYFDGLSARAVPVRLRIEGGLLHIEGVAAAGAAPSAADDLGHGAGAEASAASARLDRRVPLADVQWPERTRHGARLAHLRGGGTLRALDAAAWDHWVRGEPIAESLVVRAQQSWRGVAIAAAVLVVAAVGAYLWGVPLATRLVLFVAPPTLDASIGEAALDSLDERLLLASAVPHARQQAIRDAFAMAVAREFPGGDAPRYELQFRTSKKTGTPPNERSFIGPNAFALPGGTIVVTDDMLTLLDGRDDVLMGVLGHELGHVQLRHGMRMVVQASLLGIAGSVIWGDFSGVFAAVPVLIGQSAYSRDFEREADAQSVRLLRANRLSPLAMVELFERLDAKRNAAKTDDKAPVFDLGIALASHPADAERIQSFRDAAER